MALERSGEGWKAALQDIDTLRTSRLALLDGGFATHLEDVLGQDISSSSLWSASLLETDQGCRAIVQTHLDFLHAGADIVSTATYQASTLAFRLAGQSPESAKHLLIKSVSLAQQARLQYAQSSPRARRPLLVLSLGPYGAALSNGVEYTGVYYVPDLETGNGKQGPPASADDIEEFHYSRLHAIASSSAWAHVDVVAFETIPRLDEAVAIRRALHRVYAQYPYKMSYASFVFPNGSHLPWPGQADAAGEEDMQKLLDDVLGVDEQGSASPLDGVGVNCTKPKYINNLVERMTAALPHVKRQHSPYLFLYPDGGLVWDGLKRVWNGEKGAEQSTHSWSDQVMEAAVMALGPQGDYSPWSGVFVGGCCKATTSDIAALRLQIDAAQTRQ